ncbi:metal-sulfur cluster assembly factor [Pseudogulbenkiania sp. MAI-1]|uniref:metal-sulfur cluster assembly factor n=1 Tax=Pseudogulbenkiania sp. MAI-1 TaxID=990370 RepID=UPI00045EBC87|nr:metal-sulfur cluster assembly factor [Pseudogulbenkiania sp. MAI-1]
MDLPDDTAVMNALSEVIDPEMGVNIVDLGLIYGIERAGNALTVRMTMTSPACPMGAIIEEDVLAELYHLAPTACLSVELVWEPAWTPERMSDKARHILGWESGT